MSDLISTRWVVITGGPSSGKTSLCLYLAYLGYPMLPESARLWTDLEMSVGKTVEEIRRDNAAFQLQVLRMKAEAEARLDPQQTWILDRGIPDSLSYGAPGEEVTEATRFKYRQVFFLESVGFYKEYFRIEDGVESAKLSNLLYHNYRDLGYSLTKIPKAPIADRANVILEFLKQGAS